MAAIVAYKVQFVSPIGHIYIISKGILPSFLIGIPFPVVREKIIHLIFWHAGWYDIISSPAYLPSTSSLCSLSLPLSFPFSALFFFSEYVRISIPFVLHFSPPGISLWALRTEEHRIALLILRIIYEIHHGNLGIDQLILFSRIIL